jgi:hypothetical protein
MRYALALVLAVALLPALSRAQDQPVPAPPAVPFAERSLDDLALMAVQLEGILLSDALETYHYPGGVLVPLGEVCRLVGLGITADPMAATAAGFIISENRPFRLSLPAAQVTIGARVMPLDSGRVEVQASDIYVDSALLSDWLPLSLQVDGNAMLVTVLPREQLPIQAQMERERRGAQARTYLPVRDLGYPSVQTPYRQSSGPFVDTSLRFSADSHEGLELQYAILASGDLLYSTGELYLYSEAPNLAPTARLTLSRSDPEGRLLGDLRARQVMLGDLDSTPLPLISPSTRDPGLLVGNFPLNRSTEFDTHTFRGNAPPGWDVELYRDASLMAFSRVGEDGRYEFAHVPLLFGLNRFRLVLNGPHGEKREEEMRFNLGDTLTPLGQHQYQLSAQGREQGGLRAIALDQYGLRRNLSLGAALANIELDDGSRHGYATLQARGYQGPVYAAAELADDLSGGWAAGLRAQTLLGDATLSLEHYQAHRFSSEVVNSVTRSVSNYTSIRLDNLRFAGSGPLLPARLSFTREKQRDGQSRSRATVGAYAVYRDLRFSHTATWLREDAGAGSDRLSGDLLVSRRRGRQYLEGAASYSLAPATHLETLAVRSQYYLRDEHTLSLALRRDAGPGDTTLTAGLSRRRGNSYLEAFTEIASGGRLALGVNLSAFIGRDDRGGGWRADPYASATQGAVSARVFLDRDANGAFGGDDTPLPGVTFYVDEGSHPSVTDARGIAFLGGLTPYRPTAIALARGSLEDPLWVPTRDGVKLVPRPGCAIPVEFPVIQAGEVSGTAYRTRAGATDPASGIDLELVNAAGSVVQTQRTAYDGFYVMTAVPGGEYLLRVSPPQAERLGLAPLSRPLSVPADGGFVDGADLTLTPAAEAPAPAPAPPQP